MILDGKVKIQSFTWKNQKGIAEWKVQKRVQCGQSRDGQKWPPSSTQPPPIPSSTRPPVMPPIKHMPSGHSVMLLHSCCKKNNIPGIERYFGLKRKSFTSGWMGGLWSIQIKTRWMGRVERIIKVTMTTMHHSFQKSPYILVFLFDDGRKSSVGLEKIKTVTRNPFPTISACCSAPPSPQPQ